MLVLRLGRAAGLRAQGTRWDGMGGIGLDWGGRAMKRVGRLWVLVPGCLRLCKTDQEPGGQRAAGGQ